MSVMSVAESVKNEKIRVANLAGSLVVADDSTADNEDPNTSIYLYHVFDSICKDSHYKLSDRVLKELNSELDESLEIVTSERSHYLTIVAALYNSGIDVHIIKNNPKFVLNVSQELCAGYDASKGFDLEQAVLRAIQSKYCPSEHREQMKADFVNHLASIKCC